MRVVTSRTHSCWAPDQERCELFGLPHVIQDQQCPAPGGQQPTQVRPGQVRIVEHRRIAGDEPGHLGDLRRDRRPTPHVPTDGHLVHPAPEPAPYLRVGSHQAGHGGLAEPASSVHPGRDAHRPATPAAGPHSRGHQLCLFPVHHPARHYGRRRERRIPGHGLNPLVQQRHRYRQHNRQHRQRLHRWPRMTPDHVQVKRPPVGAGGRIPCQGQQRGVQHHRDRQDRDPDLAQPARHDTPTIRPTDSPSTGPSNSGVPYACR